MGIFNSISNFIFTKKAKSYLKKFDKVFYNASNGSEMRHARYETYLMLQRKVISKLDGDPSRFSEICINLDQQKKVRDPTLLGLYCLLHDSVYSLLITGEYHLEQGILDMQGPGPHLVNIMQFMGNFAIDEHLFNRNTIDELLILINYAIENISPGGQRNRGVPVADYVMYLYA